MAKYPWTASSIIIIWIMTTYIILNQPSLDVNRILFITFLGTALIAMFGFRPPKID